MDCDTGGSPRSVPPQRFQGTAASHGIAIGHAVVVHAPQERLLHWSIVPPAQRENQLERYHRARTQLVETIRAGLQHPGAPLADAYAIVESYELIVNDPALEQTIQHRILGEGMPAEVAVSTAYDMHIHALASAQDAIIRERRHDLDNIRQKLLAALLSEHRPTQPLHGAILVAPSLLASDVLQFHDQGISGLVTEVGGISSHACIVARTLGIPAVIGVRNATRMITDDTLVIVDGLRGNVIVAPDDATLEHYRQLYKAPAYPHSAAHAIATTHDGIVIPVYASVDSPEEVPQALALGADGIGLVRTELLLLRMQHFPSEEEQFSWYRAIVERAYPKPVTLRLFDLGSDKAIGGMPHEPNPALGLRGLRFLAQRNDLLVAHLRAILRASAQRTVRLLVPMVTSLDEVDFLYALLQATKQELRDRDQPYDDRIPIGIMIETPAAALLADELARRVAFFSIGTNDLTQYTLAADRSSDVVAHLFDQLHPAVLRLIHLIVGAAKRHGIPVELCGDLASFPSATDLLVGLGISAMSVTPTSTRALKDKIRSIRLAEAQRLAQQALQASDSAAIHALLNHRVHSP